MIYSISGLCEKCLYDTDGLNCENCRKWTYGDAINAKECKECECDRDGTDYCDTETGQCHCFEGVEGERCDKCKPDHWGFEFGVSQHCAVTWQVNKVYTEILKVKSRRQAQNIV